MTFPTTYRQLDAILANYLEQMWKEEEPITYAGHLLSGLRRFCPHWKWKIPTAKQYFANWKASHVAVQAVPMPAKAVMALAGAAVQHRELNFACLLLIGFLGFLRTGEMVTLEANKIEVSLAMHQIILALPATKTSQHREESICIHDDRVASLAYAVLQSTTGRLWPFSTAAFRKRLHELCCELSLDEFQFSAYSIRRGGASYAFSTGESFDALLVKGRWQNAKTARIYLDTGRAALIQQRFTPRQIQKQDQAIGSLIKCIEQLRRRRASLKRKSSA